MKLFHWLSMLLALITLSNLSLATAANPEISEILRRLDHVEQENQMLHKSNERLEQFLNLRAAQTPASSDELYLPPVNLFLASKEEIQQPGPEESALQMKTGIENLQKGLEKVGVGTEELGKNLTVTTAFKQYESKIAIFGAFTGEIISAGARPLIPSAISMISPDFGNDTKTVELHAKSSYIGASVIGPKVGCFQSGGFFLAYFYGEVVDADLPGLFLARAYGELKNDYWRFSFGLDGDLVVPLFPTTLNWPIGNGAGNMGYQRAQFRVERYFYPAHQRQLTLQFGLTDPTVTSYVDFDSSEGLQEDNGWPNVEGRFAWGCGPRCELAGEKKRTFELGVSGLVGQLRRTGISTPTTADVWAYGIDLGWKLTDRLGIKGEFFHGQTIGTYNAAIIQNFNANRQGIRAIGGWGEVYYYWTPCLHSHVGYSTDDPFNDDLTPGLPSRNEFVFGNIIWDMTKSIEIGFELSHWKTEYMAPVPGNETMVYHMRVRMKF